MALSIKLLASFTEDFRVDYKYKDEAKVQENLGHGQFGQFVHSFKKCFFLVCRLRKVLYIHREPR